MKIKALVYLLGGLLFASCGNSSRSDSEYIPVTDYSTIEDSEEDGSGGYEEYLDTEEEGSPDIGNIRLTGRIETCNKCRGYGMVQDGLYGQPEICKFCWLSTYMRMQQGWTGFDGRYGQVDAVFNSLPADFFSDPGWNVTLEGGENSGGASRSQIEAEIARHEENIAQLEGMLEYIDGSVNRTQIQQQIIEERYEIKRLKAMLNGM